MPFEGDLRQFMTLERRKVDQAHIVGIHLMPFPRELSEHLEHLANVIRRIVQQGGQTHLHFGAHGAFDDRRVEVALRGKVLIENGFAHSHGRRQLTGGDAAKAALAEETNGGLDDCGPALDGGHADGSTTHRCRD